MGQHIRRSRFIKNYIENLRHILREVPMDDIERGLQLLEKTYVEYRHVFLAGNGGSAATASHMANDLMKGVAKSGGRGFRAVALSDNVPLITAIANDENYNEIFSGQLANLGQKGDLLIVLSASGNSTNIIRAVEVAQQMNMNSIAFLGMGGGKVAEIVDVAVVVPSDEYGPIEDLHMVFDHLITAYLQAWLLETNNL